MAHSISHRVMDLADSGGGARAYDHTAGPTCRHHCTLQTQPNLCEDSSGFKV